MKAAVPSSVCIGWSRTVGQLRYSPTVHRSLTIASDSSDSKHVSRLLMRHLKHCTTSTVTLRMWVYFYLQYKLLLLWLTQFVCNSCEIIWYLSVQYLYEQLIIHKNNTVWLMISFLFLHCYIRSTKQCDGFRNPLIQITANPTNDIH